MNHFPGTLLKTAATLLGLLFLPSCVMLHSSPMHNTPCFTGKNQFEGSGSVSLAGIDGNFAYSPANYFSIQANAHTSVSDLRINWTGDHGPPFNDEFEIGLGGYSPLDRFVLGAVTGYGMGYTRWDRWFFNNEPAESFYYARYDTKKIYISFYFAYLLKKGSYIGFSGKTNLMRNTYSTVIHSITHSAEHNFTRTEVTSECMIFFRKKVDRGIYYTYNLGVQNLPGSAHTVRFRPFGSIGLLFKI